MIIRLNPTEVLTCDSQEYEILHNATLKIKGVPGAVVEIGTRRGGSARIMIEALYNNEDAERPMFCIDPYGNIDYVQTNKSLSVHNPEIAIEGDPNSTEITKAIKLDYDNNMRNQVIPTLYAYAYAAGLDFTFYCLEDNEFFARFADGVPVYNEYKTLVNSYALVFFDGPHNNEKMIEELEFFLPRSVVGSVFVFDDIWMYSHDETMESRMFAQGWETLEKGRVKASYVKVR